MRGGGLREVTCVGAVLGLVLTLQGCGTASGLDENEPVDADVWSPPENIEVVSSEGYRGQDCCDVHHVGGRYTRVDGVGMGPNDTEAAIVASLRDQGWRDVRCVRWVDDCLQGAGVFVAVRTLPSRADAAVEMHFQRQP